MSGFAFTYLSSSLWPSLASFNSIFALLFIAFMLFFIRKRYFFMIGISLGVLWASIVGQWYLSWQLPSSYLNEMIIIEGEIDSAVHHDNATKFDVIVSMLGKSPTHWSPKVRLFWFSPSFPVKQGNKVRLLVKLKHSRGLANPGGFDYEKWLASENIVATGYIQSSVSNQVLSYSQTFRQDFIDYIMQSTLNNKAWILSLSIGYRSLLSQSDWQLLQRTGTAHLFAISGLHVGIVALVSYWCASSVLGLIYLLKGSYIQGNFTVYNYMLVVVSCLLYALLSGLAAPVLRAWLMILCIAVLMIYRRHWRPISIFLAIMTIFLLLFPLATLSLSFWMSFTAVAFVWFLLWRFKTPRKVGFKKYLLAIKNVIRFQGLLWLLMIPLSLSSFSIFSLSSPFINIVAVPIVTIILVPLCLMALFLFLASEDAAMVILRLIDLLFNFFISKLSAVSALDWSALEFNVDAISAWWCLGIAMLVLLLPRIRFQKRITALLTLPILSYFMEQDTTEYWQVTVLDVGQGLSVVIQKNSRVMLYDTGGAYGHHFNIANTVILPYLEYLNIEAIDVMMISHFDNDHAGGMSFLNDKLSITSILSPNTACILDKPYFMWQGLKVETLWPAKTAFGSKNNLSCVIKVSDEHYSILLPGDIELEAEERLLSLPAARKLNANIVIAPHHGSKTSSTDAFVRKVAANYVVFSTGYKNRWQFPDPEVENRYFYAGTTPYNTAVDGSVSFIISKNNIQVAPYRTAYNRRWYHRTD